MELNSTKEMLKKIYLALFLFAALACKAEPRVETDVEGSTNLKPDIQQSIVAKELVNLIENYHYKKVRIDDSFSSDVFDRYIKSLDPGRTYFLQSDISDFQQFKNQLGDDFRKGDLSAPFYMFNVYQKRYTDRLKYAIAQINNKFDFSTDDQYTYDREKMPWLKSDVEANELWNKRV